MSTHGAHDSHSGHGPAAQQDPHGSHRPVARLDSHAGHDQHAGHSPAMFRDRFWLSLILTIPVVYWSAHVQDLLNYRAPQFTGAAWIPPVLGTVVFVYGGLVFLIGSGLSSAAFGLRARYEFRREFAPYLGVVWERGFGRSAELARLAGDAASGTYLVAGLRLWR